MSDNIVVLVPTRLCERRERWRETDGRFGAVGPTFSGKVGRVFYKTNVINRCRGKIFIYSFIEGLNLKFLEIVAVRTFEAMK